jgi:predicted MFS family arabinose efflux permease
VDLLTPAERGWGNGVQVAAYRVGMILGGGLMLPLFDTLGWSPTLLSLGVLLLVATVPVALFREPPSPAPPSLELGPWMRAAFMDWVKRPGAFSWILLLILYKAGEHLATGMLRTFLVDSKLGLTEVGWMLGGVGFTAGLVGALAGGALINKLGRRRALLLFGVLQAATVLLYALAAALQPSLPVLTLICGIEHLAGGMATATLFTLMMEACRTEHAASDYTVQASIVVWASILSAAVSGFSAQTLGYTGHFVLSAILCLGAVLYAALTFHPPEPSSSASQPEVSS